MNLHTKSGVVLIEFLAHVHVLGALSAEQLCDWPVTQLKTAARNRFLQVTVQRFDSTGGIAAYDHPPIEVGPAPYLERISHIGQIGFSIFLKIANEILCDLTQSRRRLG